jgi:hypothetical protein
VSIANFGDKRSSGFPKGVSGNPGGRPKGLERTAREAMALREYTAKDGITYKGDAAAFHCLIDMFFDDKANMRERIAAFKEWCDRGHGKAKQKVEVTGDVTTTAVEGRAPEDMTDDELKAALDAIKPQRQLGAVAADDGPEH